VDDSDRREFAGFAAARSGALIGVAFLLTGDQHAAEDLLQTAFDQGRGPAGLARRDHGSGCYSSARSALSDSGRVVTPSGPRIGEVSLNPLTMQ
jgi:hypothetical protein